MVFSFFVWTKLVFYFFARTGSGHTSALGRTIPLSLPSAVAFPHRHDEFHPLSSLFLLLFSFSCRRFLIFFKIIYSSHCANYYITIHKKQKVLENNANQQSPWSSSLNFGVRLDRLMEENHISNPIIIMRKESNLPILILVLKNPVWHLGLICFTYFKL